MIEAFGDRYHDDRVFVLEIVRCDVRHRRGDYIEWIVYRSEPPRNALWGVVTYRNTAGYPPMTVDGFRTREEAEKSKRDAEPGLPRISLGGRCQVPPPAYDDFIRWKTELGLKEYDYATLYPPEGRNAVEIVAVHTYGRDSVPPAV